MKVTDADVIPIQLDITSPQDVADAARRCGDVTLLINNAALWSMTNGIRIELRPQRTLVLGIHSGYIDTRQAAGVIVTNLIETIVIDEPENVVKIKLQAKAGGVEGYQAEFNCEGLEVRTKGYTEGLNEGNVNEMSTTSTLTFAGETTLETEVNLGSGFIGPFESGETTVAKVKGEKLEIKT